MEIYPSRRNTKSATTTSSTQLRHAVVAADQDDGKVLYLGPDRAGNLLEVVSVLHDDGSEIVIHAMRMRRIYESFLRGKGDTDD